jgi:hypothetical protein
MSGTGSNKGTQFVHTLRINSSNRIDPVNSTDSNFLINVGNQMQQVIKVSPISVTFPRVFYNVFNTAQKFNNAFAVTIIYASNPTVQAMVLIPPGFYTATLLANAISTAIATLDSNAVFAFTWNVTSQRYTVTATLGGTGGAAITSVMITRPVDFVIIGSIPLSTYGLSQKEDYDPFGLLGILIPPTSGMSLLGLLFNSTHTTYTGVYAPSLNNPALAYIQSRALAPMNSLDETGKGADILMEVMMGDVPQGSTVTWRCQQDILCEVDYGSPRMLSQIDIQLVDHDGDPLDLQGNELNLFLRYWLNTY